MFVEFSLDQRRYLSQFASVEDALYSFTRDDRTWYAYCQVKGNTDHEWNPHNDFIKSVVRVHRQKMRCVLAANRLAWMNTLTNGWQLPHEWFSPESFTSADCSNWLVYLRSIWKARTSD